MKDKKVEKIIKNIEVSSALVQVEWNANIICAKFLSMVCAADIIVLILAVAGVFWVDKADASILFSCLFVTHLAISLICFKFKGESKAFKPILFIIILATMFLTAAYTGYGFWIVLGLPILLTSYYYKPSFTIIITIATEVLFALSIMLGYFWGADGYWIDVNLVSISNGSIIEVNNGIGSSLINGGYFDLANYMKNAYLLYFLPQSIIIILFGVIAVLGSKNGTSMLQDEAEILAAKTKAEKEAADSRTQIMISQIQPHFIYNTLNSIYYLCDKEPETAKKAIADFSDYLRTNLNFMDKKAFVSFEQELEHIKKYLALEKMRFEDELNIEYDIKCTTFKLPALSVQPLVENAVKHGVCKKQGGGTVKISSRDALEFFEIKIEDNGVGFEVDKPFDDSRRHIGLENTKNRLKDMCNASFEIESELGVGTRVTLKIPKENYYEDSSRR